MVRTPNGMRYLEIFERHPGNPIITVEDILWAQKLDQAAASIRGETRHSRCDGWLLREETR